MRVNIRPVRRFRCGSCRHLPRGCAHVAGRLVRSRPSARVRAISRRTRCQRAIG